MSKFYSNQKKNISTRFTSVDEFSFCKELGRGGYSTVYLVRHLRTGRKYALKCAMKFKKGKDRSRKTLQEIEVLSQFNHSSIIRLSGWFEDEDTIYLVLQYIPGRDLSKFFKNTLPSKHTVKNIIFQIVESLQYCHEKGVIHRDMKLENILINKKLQIKLTDFGLCVLKEEVDDVFYDEVGTARYTSPELLSGNGYNESIDVWGVGIIMFMLLTGKYPFNGSKRRSIFRRIKNNFIDYSEYDFRSEEIHLLKRLLCKKPRYRIKLDDIKKHPWFKDI